MSRDAEYDSAMSPAWTAILSLAFTFLCFRWFLRLRSEAGSFAIREKADITRMHLFLAGNVLLALFGLWLDS